MKFVKKLRFLAMQWVYCFVEILCAMPILATLGIVLLGEFGSNFVWWFLGTLPVAYLLGMLVKAVLPEKVAFLRFIALVILALGLTYYSLGIRFGVIPQIIPAVFVYAAAVLRGFSYATGKWRNVFPRELVWISYILYCVALFMYRELGQAGNMDTVYYTPLLVMGVINVFLTMLLSNMDMLKEATLSEDEHVSKTHQLFNWGLVAIGAGLILLVTFADRIKNFFEKAATLIAGGLLYIYNAVFNFFNSSSGTGEQGESVDLSELLGDAKDTTSHANDWVSVLIKVVAFVAIAIFAAFLLYKIGKLLVKLYKIIYAKIKANFKGEVTEQSSGFYDTEEKMLSLKDLGQIYSDKLKDWLKERRHKEPAYGELKTNRERIRYIYRNYIFRRIGGGYQYKPYLTPKETVADAETTVKKGKKAEDAGILAEAYGEARYGEAELADEEVAVLKKQFYK